MGKTFAELEKEYAQERTYAKARREAEEKKAGQKRLIREIRGMKMERKYGTAIRITKKVGKKVAQASVALADATIPKQTQPKRKASVVKRKLPKKQKQTSMFAPTQDWGSLGF